MVTAMTTLKESIEEKKFTKGENNEKMQEWAADVEAAVDEADTCVRQLPDKIDQIDRHLRHGEREDTETTRGFRTSSCRRISL